MKQLAAPPDIKSAALAELADMIDDERLKNWLLDIFHKSGVRCCHCGQPLSPRAEKTFLEYKITSCIHCGLKVQFFRNTLFQGAKISPKTFFLLAAFIELGVSVSRIAEALVMSRSSVREWAAKLAQGETKVPSSVPLNPRQPGDELS